MFHIKAYYTILKYKRN